MHIAVNLRLYVQGTIGGLENYVRYVVAGSAENQKRKKQPLTIFVRQTLDAECRRQREATASLNSGSCGLLPESI